MKIYRNFNIEKKFKHSAIAIGNFDGFHIGHQRVINRAKKISRMKRVKFGLITFEPLPVIFFNKNIKTRKMYRKIFFIKSSLTPLLNEVIFLVPFPFRLILQ